MQTRLKLIKVFFSSFIILISQNYASDSESLTEESYELRGIFELDGECTFSLFHKPTGMATWAGMGQTVLGEVRLIDYDTEHKELTIAQNNQIKVLKIKKADEKQLDLVVTSQTLKKATDSENKSVRRW